VGRASRPPTLRVLRHSPLGRDAPGEGGRPEETSDRPLGASPPQSMMPLATTNVPVPFCEVIVTMMDVACGGMTWSVSVEDNTK
jgi:hypothetical protein